MNSAVLTTTRVVPAFIAPRHFFGARNNDVATNHEVRAAGGDTNGVNFLGRVGDADMAVNGAAFLREAGHVDDADTLAFEMRCHADDRADRDNAGAADTGDDDSVRMIDQRYRRCRQR